MTDADRDDQTKELTFTRFDRMSITYPDRTAVVYLGERFSYRRLRDLAERFARQRADEEALLLLIT